MYPLFICNLRACTCKYIVLLMTILCHLLFIRLIKAHLQFFELQKTFHCFSHPSRSIYIPNCKQKVVCVKTGSNQTGYLVYSINRTFEYFGVKQGNVCSPLLFTVYNSPARRRTHAKSNYIVYNRIHVYNNDVNIC